VEKALVPVLVTMSVFNGFKGIPSGQSDVSLYNKVTGKHFKPSNNTQMEPEYYIFLCFNEETD